MRPMPQVIDEPGIYQLTSAEYHADPCVIPSLSRSIAKWLIDTSPAHARVNHPRFGGQGDDHEAEEPDVAKTAEARDIGTAAHSAFLLGESVVVPIPFETYASKAAKQARDEALAAGKVPLKQAQFDRTMRVVEALERYRARTGAFTKGRAEQTLIWREGPIWCRCRVDWLEDDPAGPLWDLKTTGGKATLDAWTRRCFDQGGHLQTPFYMRGAAEVRDGQVPSGFVYIVVETSPPYGIKRFELSPAGQELAATQMGYALRLWELCQGDNRWPGYPDDPEWIDPPAYVLRAWEFGSAHLSQPKRLGVHDDPALIDRMIKTGNFGG